jgi:hypothetical protein
VDHVWLASDEFCLPLAVDWNSQQVPLALERCLLPSIHCVVLASTVKVSRPFLFFSTTHSTAITRCVSPRTCTCACAHVCDVCACVCVPSPHVGCVVPSPHVGSICKVAGWLGRESIHRGRQPIRRGRCRDIGAGGAGLLRRMLICGNGKLRCITPFMQYNTRTGTASRTAIVPCRYS